METAHAPWRVLAATVCGTRHIDSGVPCQDACHHTILADGTLVLAMADGAGSARRAEVGAALAVQAAVSAVTLVGDLPEGCNTSAWRVFLIDVLQTVREAVEAEARSLKVELRDLATTFILTIATADCVAALHLGDGAVVLHDMDGQCFTLTAPQIGEYLNETSFLTDQDACDTALIAVHKEPVQHICILSDGLQMLALSMPGGTPHTPFFMPLFKFVDKVKDEASAREQLTAFLTSPRITERTDDDVSLCLVASS